MISEHYENNFSFFDLFIDYTLTSGSLVFLKIRYLLKLMQPHDMISKKKQNKTKHQLLFR